MSTPPLKVRANCLPAGKRRSGRHAFCTNLPPEDGTLHSTLHRRPRPTGFRPLLGRTDLDGFFAQVRATRRRVLLLDFDGTLAPLVADRSRARPYPGIRAALATLSLAPCSTAIWVVSGRTVSDLTSRIRLDRLVDLWGSHGLERRTKNGCWVGPAPSRPAAEVLDRVAEAMRRMGAEALVERKLYGLALHGRGTPHPLYLAARRALVRDFTAPASAAGLAFAAFDGGIELRPEGAHKGTTVDRAFAEFGADAAVAYLGDDQTDEDAFAALRDRGMPVLVAPRPRPTLARAWIHAPAGVLEFLADWHAACAAEAP
jgi:trehalose 6-phosphate phosphatase